MADNSTRKDAANATETIASDDIGGVKFPRSKVVWGVDGAAVDASLTNPLPVTATANATMPIPVSGGQYRLAIPAASTTLTVPATATHALVTNDDDSTSNVRWTRDGTTPTATVGHQLLPGDTFEFDNLSALKFFGGATCNVQVSYHKYA